MGHAQPNAKGCLYLLWLVDAQQAAAKEYDDWLAEKNCLNLALHLPPSMHPHLHTVGAMVTYDGLKRSVAHIQAASLVLVFEGRRTQPNTIKQRPFPKRLDFRHHLTFE